jgi:hypothetical protein
MIPASEPLDVPYHGRVLLSLSSLEGFAHTDDKLPELVNSNLAGINVFNRTTHDLGFEVKRWDWCRA